MTCAIWVVVELNAKASGRASCFVRNSLHWQSDSCVMKVPRRTEVQHATTDWRLW